jgi:hypothetical protein
MKTKLLALMLLASGSMFARTHVSIGVNLGGFYGGGYYVAAPPPPPPVYYAPPAPRPGYVWVSGYYYPVGARYEYRAGYWARPPYRNARWYAPRYERGRYYRGYWR